MKELPPNELVPYTTFDCSSSRSASDQCEKYFSSSGVILEPSPGRSRCQIVPGNFKILVNVLSDSEPNPGPPGRNNQL